MTTLDGEVAFVTGASRGIRAAVAPDVCDRGHDPLDEIAPSHRILAVAFSPMGEEGWR